MDEAAVKLNFLNVRLKIEIMNEHTVVTPNDDRQTVFETRQHHRLQHSVAEQSYTESHEQIMPAGLESRKRFDGKKILKYLASLSEAASCAALRAQ